ncbi:glycosyltransferase 87 family protein [Rhodoglobus sp. NPDC076762]
MLNRHTVSALALWLLFVGGHLVLGLLNLHGPGNPFGDVTFVYAGWAQQAYGSGIVVGVDMPWVYPLLAIVPILASVTFGLEYIGATWLTLVMLLNLVALGFVTRWGRSRRGVVVGWWWLGFLVALGPIALGRIDAVTVSIALIGVGLLSTRPRAAGVVLACATWVKVWPAALILAALIAVRARWTIAIAAAAATATVVVFALLAGSGGYVFSFVTEQTGRGIQVESPVAGIWLWQIVAGARDSFIYYDSTILTFQVAGHHVATVAALMTPLLAAVVVAVAALGIRANRSIERAGTGSLQLLGPLSLALVLALIVVNKVGSPQFVSWLAVPVILGLVTAAPRSPRRWVPAAFSIAIAALTQLVYPYFYERLLAADPVMVAVVTARNVLLLALLVWALADLVRLGRPALSAQFESTGEAPTDATSLTIPTSPPHSPMAKESI